MKSWSTGLSATLMAFGLAISLSSLAGCGGKTECSTSSDCAEGQVCDADGQCVTPEDKCANVSCPGLQTCNADTGACEGECCGSNSCTNPRTECDETKCAAGDADYCVDKVCPGDGPNLGCQAGFTCNQTDQVCEPDCLPEHDGCPNKNELCDTDSASDTYGQCILTIPSEGEVGAPCEANTDCNSGLICYPESTIGPGGYCSKNCNSDAECPQSSLCAFGICWDACDSTIGDCGPDRQCLEDSNDAGAPISVCYPLFDESTCETDCLPNGVACDPTVADQCEAGSACIDWVGGLATCAKTSCHLFDNGCAADESCESLGSGLTACLNTCDPTDPTACQDLANDNGNPQCSPSPQILGPFDVFSEASTADACPNDNLELSLGGQTSYICYTACTDDSTCNAGQFCGEIALGQGIPTFNACMNYNVVEGGCTACGDLDCADLGGGAAACFLGCTSSDECNAELGGACNRLTFNNGGEMDICLYSNTGSVCLSGCQSDADCGYCETDADCPAADGPSGTTRPQLCDQATHTCQVPLNGATEVAQWCRSGQELYANAIELADGSYKAGCAFACTDDLDCGGPCVDGYCQSIPQLCNGPTGQCEDLCNTGDTCLFGDCATGDVEYGGRCVLGCDAGTSCEAGVCDEAAGYCVYDCAEAGCAAGYECNATSGLCDMLMVSVDTLTLGGDDVLTDNAATVASGTASLEWATTNATQTSLATAAAEADCSQVATDGWTAVDTFPGGPSGTFDLSVTENVCARFVATGDADAETIYFSVGLQ